MRDPARAVDGNFIRRVRLGELPAPATTLRLQDTDMTPGDLLDLFQTQLASRHIDLQARLLRSQGKGFYTIGSSGHEGTAVVGRLFRYTDMAFLHYRSSALFIQRSKQLPNHSVLYDMLLSLLASSEEPISGGRHKVLGSKALTVPPQTSTIASHLPKAVGMAYAIPLAHALGIQSVVPADSVVICSFGDASVNHSTAQGAFNWASMMAFRRFPLPILFLCEDNGLGISTPSPEGWIEAAMGHRPGLHYLQCDGTDLLDSWSRVQEAERLVRHHRQPVFLHMQMVRLLGHAGSDLESGYRTERQITESEGRDPLLYSARLLLENGILSAQEICDLYEAKRREIDRLAALAVRQPVLDSARAVAASLTAHVPSPLPPWPEERRRKVCFEAISPLMSKPEPMGRLLNWALMDLMLRYPNMVLFGEDVGIKGGVYGVTQHLYRQFGPRRVMDTLLDEQSILGLAIGLAHNGFLPVAEIQFLAYLHNAEDQIRGEAATLAFFSQGQFTNPMLIRLPGLAYQKGFGGHFHNDNSLSVLRDIPGLIIACPSNGLDAVRMLRSCAAVAWQQKRVVVFVEPIALYTQRDLHVGGDGLWCHRYPAPEGDREIPVGEFAVEGKGRDLCILTYGNGVRLSRQAIRVLQKQYGINTRLLDLRWLAPLDAPSLVAAIAPCDKLLIVDECRKSGSPSEGVMVALMEAGGEFQIQRVTALDCFIPLGEAADYLLPQPEGIVQAALSLL